MSQMCGGLTPVKPATDTVQEIVNQVTDELIKRTGRNLTKLTAVSFKSQIVAGTNYFVKVRVDDGDYIHLRIFQSLPHQKEGPCLSAYVEGKKEDDEIVHFE